MRPKTHTHREESWREGNKSSQHTEEEQEPGRRDGRSWFRQYCSGRESDRIVQEEGSEGEREQAGEIINTHTQFRGYGIFWGCPGIVGVFPHSSSRLFSSILF
jgi:hypothetical protein